MKLNRLLLAALLAILPANTYGGVTLTYPNTLSNGTLEDATKVMGNFNQIITTLANSAAASGTNNDITSLTALSSPISLSGGATQLFIGSGASTGSANAQAVTTLVPGGYALNTGNAVLFKAGFTNTGATTLAFNAQTATNVYMQSPAGPQALQGGEIVLNQWVLVVYDGAQFELIGSPASAYGTLGTLASAGTTSLGTVGSRFVSITGTTTITSFGNTTGTGLYFITFTGALTLTYNSGSLIVPGAANITTQAGDVALVQNLGSGNWQVLQYWSTKSFVTSQTFGAGSGNYTPTVGTRKICVRMWGGGGGGGGFGTSATTGGSPGNTSFGSWTAVSGGGGVGVTSGTGANGANGTGGTNGTGALLIRMSAEYGFGGGGQAAAFSFAGQSPVGGTATAGFGWGAGGGGGNSAVGSSGGNGGGGEYVEFCMSNPGVTAYSIAAAASAGTGGTKNGAAGTAGEIVIQEFYN